MRYVLPYQWLSSSTKLQINQVLYWFWPIFVSYVLFCLFPPDFKKSSLIPKTCRVHFRSVLLQVRCLLTFPHILLIVRLVVVICILLLKKLMITHRSRNGYWQWRTWDWLGRSPDLAEWSKKPCGVTIIFDVVLVVVCEKTPNSFNLSIVSVWHHVSDNQKSSVHSSLCAWGVRTSASWWSTRRASILLGSSGGDWLAR